VARAFGVGVSTVKRWTEEGELEAAKTPGKHRRYTLAALHDFARVRRLNAALPPLDLAETSVARPLHIELFRALQRGDDAAVRRIVDPPQSHVTKRAAFLDRVVGEAMRDIGEAWACGKLDVEQEHRATYIMSEVIDSLRPAMDGETRPAVLLACPPHEWHELPLRLVRLVFEWKGWRTEYAGANVPWRSIVAAIERVPPRAVVLSARSGEPFRYTDFQRLVELAGTLHCEVVVGGEWARGGTAREAGFHRFRTLRGLAKWLE
jgi:excisionase family DNA binding protein